GMIQMLLHARVAFGTRQAVIQQKQQPWQRKKQRRPADTMQDGYTAGNRQIKETDIQPERGSLFFHRSFRHLSITPLLDSVQGGAARPADHACPASPDCSSRLTRRDLRPYLALRLPYTAMPPRCRTDRKSVV